MASPEERLRELSIALSGPTAPLAAYAPANELPLGTPVEIAMVVEVEPD